MVEAKVNWPKTKSQCSTMDNQLRVIQSRLGQEQNKNEKLCTKLQSKIETKVGTKTHCSM